MNKTDLESIDTLLIDCDGVLWRGQQSIAGAFDALNALRAGGKRLVFVTNNSTKSREEYTTRFASLGLDGVATEDVFGSAYVTALYMKEQLPQGSKVYVVGGAGIVRELELAGLVPVGMGDEDKVYEKLEAFPVDDDVAGVVVGFVSKLSYYKFAYAAQVVRGRPERPFVATNRDATFPADGMILPGGGAAVAFLATAAGREPVTMGKPSPTLFATIRAAIPAIDPARTLMVGDRMNTDIQFGNSAGMRTLLVLTVVNSRADAEALPADDVQRPTFITDSFADLQALL